MEILLAGIVPAIAVLVMAIALRSSSNARDDLASQLVTSVRSDAQRAIDDQAKAAQVAALTTALQAQTARANALEEFISHEAKTTDPAAGLAPDDVAGRVLRLSQRWGASVPAPGGADDQRPDATVRDAGATQAPHA